MILAIILCIPIFPIFLLFVKVVSIIHHGKEWKKLKVILTYYEGQFESFLGFGLQTYIILERADRQPSMIQKVSIIASLLMMVVSEQNVHFSKTNSVPLQDDIKRRVKVLPLFLTGFIFVLGSAAVIATTDPFYLLYFIIAIIGILCCLYLCLTSLLIWKKYCPLKQATRRNQIQNLFHKIFRHSIYITTVSSKLLFSCGKFDFFLAGFCWNQVYGASCLVKWPINQSELAWPDVLTNLSTDAQRLPE